jgi:RNA polymerase sigma-70 factor (ECF subfamily)
MDSRDVGRCRDRPTGDKRRPVQIGCRFFEKNVSAAPAQAAKAELPILSRMKPDLDADTRSLQALIAGCRAGRPRQLCPYYERTHTHLFGVAVRILGQGQAAEDVLQEAYVSIWKSAAGYRNEVDGQTIQPMTWLIAIVRNKALDAFRARARRKETELPESGDVDEEDTETTPRPPPAPRSCLSRPPKPCI